MKRHTLCGLCMSHKSTSLHVLVLYTMSTADTTNASTSSSRGTKRVQYKYLQSRKPLGRGTFCSISVCYDLSTDKRTSLVPVRYAIKTEVSEFQNSGIMDGEARVLEYLSLMIPDAVPKYIDLVDVKREVLEMRDIREVFSDSALNASFSNDVVVSSESSSIVGLVMELFEGEDMHELVYRTWQERANKSQQPCIIDPLDALELTLIVLRILEKIHNTGMVHRDVKPSNFVRTSTDKKCRDLKVVDFGLTKSFIVPEGSSDAALDKPWHRTSLYDFKALKQKKTKGGMDVDEVNDESDKKPKAFYRKPRARGKAEFRGASMYASPYVHLLEEYCPRDDLFSCLFIFLDMTQGDLPWAAAASARQRDECGIQKDKCLQVPENFLHRSCSPTVMEHLAVILAHLMNLSYFDMPDYDLLEKHFRGMAENLDRNLGNKLLWQCPKLPHQKIGKDLALQLSFYQMKNTLKNICDLSNVAKLEVFLNFTMSLMDGPWPHQYEAYPEFHKPQYRKTNFVRAIEEALDYAKLCDYFQSSSYYEVVDTAKRSKLMLDVSIFLYSLHNSLEIEFSKPLLPPPSINFRRQSA